MKNAFEIKYRGTRAWCNQLIDQIVPLQLLIQPSKGQSEVLQVTWLFGYQVNDCSVTRILS